MNPSKNLSKLVLATLVGIGSVCLFGCGSKDVDPGAKVDAPGYYNGPMDPKGKSAEAAKPGGGGSKASTD